MTPHQKKRNQILANNIELTLVGMLVLAGMLNPSLQLWMLAGLGLIIARRLVKTGYLQFRTSADAGVLLLLMAALANASVQPGNADWRDQIVRLLTGIAVYYWIVSAWKSTSHFALFFRLAAGAGLALGAMALFTVSWPIGKTGLVPEILYRALQTTILDQIHPNVMAGSIVLFFPLILAKILFPSSESITRKNLFAYGATGLLLLAILLLTKSRGAFWGLLTGSTLVILPRWNQAEQNKRRLFLQVSTVGVVCTFLLAIAVSSTLISEDIDFRMRAEIWSRALAVIYDFPLTGSGMGAYGDLVDKYYPFFINQEGSIPHAHNLYLQIAADLGLTGLVAWLSILVNVLIACVQIFRNRVQWEIGGALGVGLAGSQAALVVHGMVDAVAWGMVRPAPFVWMLWGAAIAAQNYTLKLTYASESPVD